MPGIRGEDTLLIFYYITNPCFFVSYFFFFLIYLGDEYGVVYATAPIDGNWMAFNSLL